MELKKAVQNIFDVISTKRIWIENILLYVVVVVVVVVAFDVGAVASATLDFYGENKPLFSTLLSLGTHKNVRPRIWSSNQENIEKVGILHFFCEKLNEIIGFQRISKKRISIKINSKK